MILDKISNRLQISLINARKISVNPQLLHLDNLVKQAYFINKFEAQKNGQHLRLSIKRKPTIFADNFAVYDIIDILIKNAIKFSNEGKTTEITLDERDGKAVVEIRDQGCGLTNDEVVRISALMRNQPVAITSTPFTTGFGFPLVKRLLDLQKGQISVCSDGKDMGSTFSVFFQTANQTIRKSINEVA
ncbi:MAG: HAMP domain-containing sensor histidine kinase [Bacteroidia bacterium]